MRDGSERAPTTSAFAISTLYAFPGSGVAASSAPVEEPGDRRDPGERDARRRRRGARPRRRRSGTPSACGPSPSGRRSASAGGTSSSRISSPGSSVVVRRSSSVGQAVELADRQLAPVRAQRRVRARAAPPRRRTGAPRRRSRSRRSRARGARPRCAKHSSPPCRRHGQFEPPVPAAGRLQQVAAERPHVAQLRARGEAARLAQRVRHLRVALELGERRAGADPGAVDPARDDAADVDERVGLRASPSRSSGTTSVPPAEQQAVAVELRRVLDAPPELQRFSRSLRRLAQRAQHLLAA